MTEDSFQGKCRRKRVNQGRGRSAGDGLARCNGPEERDLKT